MKTKILMLILFLSAVAVKAQEVKPIGENETIDFNFLHNNWEVVMVAFGEASISGENLKQTPHYFTMKMGEYGDFYQSNLDYETATFGHNSNTNILTITTSKGGEITNKNYNIKRLVGESMVLQDPLTETIYYLTPVME